MTGDLSQGPMGVHVVTDAGGGNTAVAGLAGHCAI